MKIGYTRVSTHGQNLDHQLGALRAERCDEIYREKALAKSLRERPELEKASISGRYDAKHPSSQRDHHTFSKVGRLQHFRVVTPTPRVRNTMFTIR